MKTFSRYAACLLVFIALAVQAQTTGQMRGTVTGEDDKGLENVKVEVSSPALQGTRTASTDKSGQFRFPPLPPGQYTVTFTLASYAEAQKSATVKLSSTVIVNIKLFRISD